MIKHLDDLALDIGFDPKKFAGESSADGDGEKAGGKSRKASEALKNLDLRKIALPVLRETDEDHFKVHVRQAGGTVRGDITVERGVLKAAGKVIAKIAAERLRCGGNERRRRI